MRKLGICIISVVGIFILNGCSQNNADYFRNHPEEMVPSALECTKLSNSDVKTNKKCMAIAEIEKPLCEQEVKIKGMVFAPSGGLADCNDPYYLIARPVIEARMKAALEGAPDPVVQYFKDHPKR